MSQLGHGKWDLGWVHDCPTHESPNKCSNSAEAIFSGHLGMMGQREWREWEWYSLEGHTQAPCTGCWLQVVGCSFLVVGCSCWLLVARCLVVAGCWLLVVVCCLAVASCWGGGGGPKKRNRPKKVQIKKIEKTVFKFLKPEKRSAAARNRTHAAGPKKQMSYRRATAPNQDSPVTVRVETVDG